MSSSSFASSSASSRSPSANSSANTADRTVTARSGLNCTATYTKNIGPLDSVRAAKNAARQRILDRSGEPRGHGFYRFCSVRRGLVFKITPERGQFSSCWDWCLGLFPKPPVHLPNHNPAV